MPSSQTPNYNLNQWSRDDRVLMEDFNADNAKIDAALGEKADKSAVEELNAQVGQVELSMPRVVFGTYTGDGAASKHIELGFPPQGAAPVLPERQNQLLRLLRHGIRRPGP